MNDRPSTVAASHETSFHREHMLHFAADTAVDRQLKVQLILSVLSVNAGRRQTTPVRRGDCPTVRLSSVQLSDCQVSNVQLPSALVSNCSVSNYTGSNCPVSNFQCPTIQCPNVQCPTVHCPTVHCPYPVFNYPTVQCPTAQLFGCIRETQTAALSARRLLRWLARRELATRTLFASQWTTLNQQPSTNNPQQTTHNEQPATHRRTPHNDILILTPVTDITHQAISVLSCFCAHAITCPVNSGLLPAHDN